MTKEFDKLKLAIKDQLKKDNTSMQEEELERKSKLIATSQLQKTNEAVSSDKFDSAGRYIVSENTKMYIAAGINTIEE